MTTRTETWKPCVGIRGYSVSSRGRVRREQGPNKRSAHVMKRYRTSTSMTALVRVSVDGTARHVPVKKIVAAAFIGPARGRMVWEVDRDRENCHQRNLEYITQREARRRLSHEHRKENCARGHPLTDDNREKDGRCRTCNAARTLIAKTDSKRMAAYWRKRREDPAPLPKRYRRFSRYGVVVQ